MVLPAPALPHAFGQWEFNLPVTIALAVVLTAYLLGVRAANRRGNRWSRWRVLAFVSLGLGSVVVCTMSALAVYDRTVFWPLAVQLTLLISIVPFCLALGDPLGLVRAALSPSGVDRWDRATRGVFVRTLTFPAVTPVLAMATQLVVFLSGYLTGAIHHPLVMDLLYLHVLATGCLIALPLLGVEMLPSWCTDPVKMLLAGLDGLLDAIPGIVLLTSGSLVAGGYYATVHRSWGPPPLFEQHVGGGLMLAVAEVVSIPLLCILFFRWARNDMNTAKAADRAAVRRTAPADSEVAATGSAASAPQLDRPWWETDERFGDRHRDVN
jgi:cytochrome c oxidase assembly factor CtaG